MSEVIYKVVELPRVTDEDLEATLNTWTSKGWRLTRIDYQRDAGVRRPLMAFVFFERDVTPHETTSHN